MEEKMYSFSYPSPGRCETNSSKKRNIHNRNEFPPVIDAGRNVERQHSREYNKRI